jgi:predicted nucleotidyltransferase component of viral defense system
MASSPPPSRLTRLQSDLLGAFFAREQRLFLTGGAALAGFYFGHRETEDLDLFGPPGLDLLGVARTLHDAASACGASVRALETHPDFRRVLAARGDERCIVDVVVDRAPMLEPAKASFGSVRVDTLREIAANKVCTLVGRAEIKDLVDLERILDAGVDLERAVQDATTKDASVDPATLAWLLDQITIGPQAALPGGVDPTRVARFREDLVRRLRALAFERAGR